MNDLVVTIMNGSDHDAYIEEKKKEFIDLQTRAANVTRRVGFKVIKLCPVCVFTAVKEVPYTGGIYPERYYCPKCDWQGVIPLEVDVKDLALLWERWLEAETDQDVENQDLESDDDLELIEEESPRKSNQQ